MPGGNRPKLGSSPPYTLKMTMSATPRKNHGMEKKTVAIARAAASIQVPVRAAASTPVPMPTTTITSVEATASSIVTGTVPSSSSVTLRPLENDCPRSPRTSPPR